MTPPKHEGPPPQRYGRDTIEFARVANLSDALFAIAMTLLVLTLDVADVPLSRLAGALADEVPRLIAVVVTFAVVAYFWWVHHRFLAVLGFLEPGLIALNLVLLLVRAGACQAWRSPLPDRAVWVAAGRVGIERRGHGTGVAGSDLATSGGIGDAFADVACGVRRGMARP